MGSARARTLGGQLTREGKGNGPLRGNGRGQIDEEAPAAVVVELLANNTFGRLGSGSRRRYGATGACGNIDIDRLTEAELVDLNTRIVERLRFLNHMRAHAQMLEFKIGDRVSFQPHGHPIVVGMLTRYNRKTVTVITDRGQRWNVAPALLRQADDGRRTDSLAPM